MKKDKIFNESLLLSQEEMAIILGVTRSQLTMYTSGYRDLSVKVKLKLEQLIRVVNEEPFSKMKNPEQEKEINKFLANELLDNKLKQLKQQRKLVRVEERYQAALNTLHFVSVLESKNTALNINATVLEVLKIKAHKVLKTFGLPQQENFKIKLEVMKFEEELLRKKMK